MAATNQHLHPLLTADPAQTITPQQHRSRIKTPSPPLARPASSNKTPPITNRRLQTGRWLSLVPRTLSPSFSSRSPPGIRKKPKTISIGKKDPEALHKVPAMLNRILRLHHTINRRNNSKWDKSKWPKCISIRVHSTHLTRPCRLHLPFSPSMRAAREISHRAINSEPVMAMFKTPQVHSSSRSDHPIKIKSNWLKLIANSK